MDCRKWLTICIASVVVGGLAIAQTAVADILRVVYPAPESDKDNRDDDVIELLRLMLEKTVATHGPFELIASSPMNEKRYRELLKKGQGVSLVWSSVTADVERDFRAIGIPLRKGVLGFRVFIIRKGDQARFAAIQSLAQLKPLLMGQGVGWNDIPLLKQNGFNVVVSSTYEGLFSQLDKGRLDYLSRGINEAWQEVEERRDKYPDLMVEQNLMLYYPWPKYFYVNRDNKLLALRLEEGLHRALADGSFDRLFKRYRQPEIERAKFGKRRIFCIDNPFLPPARLAEIKKWQFEPEGFKCNGGLH